MNVAKAEKNFAKLVDKVCAEGISVDLERDGEVIARPMPAEPTSPLTVGVLNTFLRTLPSLGDDADQLPRTSAPSAPSSRRRTTHGADGSHGALS